MSTIIINGTKIQASVGNISIINGVIKVDGIQIDNDESKNINIEGNIRSISCTGNVVVHGDVSGDIECGGSVTCKNVGGDIDCGGSVRAHDVKQNIDAGGSVHISK